MLEVVLNDDGRFRGWARGHLVFPERGSTLKTATSATPPPRHQQRVEARRSRFCGRAFLHRPCQGQQSCAPRFALPPHVASRLAQLTQSFADAPANGAGRGVQHLCGSRRRTPFVKTQQQGRPIRSSSSAVTCSATSRCSCIRSSNPSSLCRRWVPPTPFRVRVVTGGTLACERRCATPAPATVALEQLPISGVSAGLATHVSHVIGGRGIPHQVSGQTAQTYSRRAPSILQLGGCCSCGLVPLCHRPAQALAASTLGRDRRTPEVQKPIFSSEDRHLEQANGIRARR